MPPNIVVFVTDDQEVDTASEAQAMPWLSAQDWLTFPNNVISTPLCGPFRGSFYTALRSDRSGATGNNDAGSIDETKTIAVALTTAGYRTGQFGKYLNLWEESTAPPGWNHFFGWHAAAGGGNTNYNWTATEKLPDGTTSLVTGGATDADYFTDVLSARAAAFVAVDDPAPFLCVVPFTAPHRPTEVATRHAAAPITAPDPPGWDSQYTNAPAWLSNFAAMTSTELDETRADRVGGRRMLLAVDEACETVYNAVPAGKLDDTIFVFLSDNGNALGRNRISATDFPNPKRQPYRYCIDANLRIKYPGVAGRVERHLVSSLDIPASILGWAGAAPLADVDGIELTSLIETGRSNRRAVHALYQATADEAGTMPRWWSLRTERWNYIEWATGEVDLFDWNADPNERANVAAANPDVTAELAPILADLKTDPHASDAGATPHRIVRPVPNGIFL